MKYPSMALSPMSTGLPSAMATMFTPKVICKSLYLYRNASTRWGSASFFSSITARMPVRSLSSRMS